MSDFLYGENALIFSYGVTNAGKTYTLQGEDANNIILVMPRTPCAFKSVLEIFQGVKKIQGSSYECWMQHYTTSAAISMKLWT